MGAGIAVGVTLVVVLIIACLYVYLQSKKREAQEKIKSEALDYLKIKESEFDSLFAEYNKVVVVKSRQTLDKYDYSSFFKDNRDYYINNLNIMNNIINYLNKIHVNNTLKIYKIYEILKKKLFFLKDVWMYIYNIFYYFNYLYINEKQNY